MKLREPQLHPMAKARPFQLPNKTRPGGSAGWTYNPRRDRVGDVGWARCQRKGHRGQRGIARIEGACSRCALKPRTLHPVRPRPSLVVLA